MKKKPTTKAVAPYNDRALAMNRAAVTNEIDEIIKTYSAVEADTSTMKTVSIKAANGCRKLGIQLQTICGHEQVSFDFWQKNCQKLAQRFDFDNAKIFIAIAKKMPKPAKTIEEAAPFTQLIYQAVDLLQLPARTETQGSVSSGPVQKFFAEITIVRKDFEKATRQMPMEHWSPPVLRSFIKDSNWLAEALEKAETLLSEKD